MILRSYNVLEPNYDFLEASFSIFESMQQCIYARKYAQKRSAVTTYQLVVVIRFAFRLFLFFYKKEHEVNY